jgi:transcriptional regulator with XRE-family HTH domain
MKHLEKHRPVAAAACRIVGANVRSVRKALGWTQTDLGRRVGIGQGAISAIERGKRGPSIQTLFLLARACEVETERLVRVPVDVAAARAGALQ